MSDALTADVQLLHELLDRATRDAGWAGPLDLFKRLRAEVERGPEAFDTVAERIAELPDDVILTLLRIGTLRFHLRNGAEQIEIARINRDRERAASPESPRPESIAEAILELAGRGMDRAAVLELARRLDIGPTLTAHPTEARRRSIMRRQQSIAARVRALHDTGATPVELERTRDALAGDVLALLATDEVRAERLKVVDEIDNGVYWLTNAIWQAVPTLYRDLSDALASLPGAGGTAPGSLPTIMRYRSWIGGDRDGNPNVTPEITASAFDDMRAAAIELHEDTLAKLREELSVSELRAPVSAELRAAIERDDAAGLIDPDATRHMRHEPYRVRVLQMLARLRALRHELTPDDAPHPDRPCAEALRREGESVYTAEAFIEDLRIIQRSLEGSGLGHLAATGTLADAIVRARTFGFHLAALDIRQHSRLHGEAIAEMLAAAGVESNYANLDEQARIERLTAELRNPRPLLPPGAETSETTTRLLTVYRTVAHVVGRDPAAMGSAVISMTHHVSHLLEVLLILKEAGLWRCREEDGVITVECPINVCPLFETIDDLRRGPQLLGELFTHPVYGAQVRARGMFQEIMLGYSDSNKDGGYTMAGWCLHTAEDELGRACAEHGVAFRFFHGRGGSVARGGGRANRAIRAAPAVSRNGRIRFTEQGEVISFRYALSDIARRHLEQIVSAMLAATGTAEGGDAPEIAAAAAPLVARAAETSMHAYRELIDDPEFWPWFRVASPVAHIGGLPLASRPVGRTGSGLEFDDLRAIPWVFAWTQMRYTCPGWYGLGSGLAEALEQPGAADILVQAHREWPFFNTLIENARQEMARARLSMAERYGKRVAGVVGGGDALHARIAGEYDTALAAVRTITGDQGVLDSNPVIRKSIERRNIETDLLNLLQIELMNRWDAADEAGRDGLRDVVLLSLNAVAAAMQSTG